MRTQFQRLTSSRAWGPEAVQADSARNLEANHVVSQDRLQLGRDLRRPPRPREEHNVWPWQPKRDADRHRPLCPQLSPSGRSLPCGGFGAWNLLGPNPNPNPTPNRDPPPKPKPASITNPACGAFWHGPSLQPSREITRPESLRPWRRPWPEP